MADQATISSSTANAADHLSIVASSQSSAADRLSIVVVTSPIALNPDTRLIDAVINSFDLVEGLQECPLVIVADGVKLVKSGDAMKGTPDTEDIDGDTGSTSAGSTLCPTRLSTAETVEDLQIQRPKRDNAKRSIWKRGRVLKDDYTRYLQYCENLRRKNCTNSSRRNSVKVIGPLEKHHSFAHALRIGLQEVMTDLVLVVQHDRAFVDRLSIFPILNLFDQFGREGLRYVGFQSRTNRRYPNKLRGRYGEWANCYHLMYGHNTEEQLEIGRKKAQDVERGLFNGKLGIGTSCDVPAHQRTSEMMEALKYHLIPLFFWYDSSHVCRTHEYIQLINEECKLGQFIETAYGAKLEKRIEEIGKRGEWSYAKHLRDFGCFLYWDCQIGVEKPIVAHLHGRLFWSEEDRRKKGWELAPALSKYSRLARLENRENADMPDKGKEEYEDEELVAKRKSNVPKVKNGLDRRQRLALRKQIPRGERWRNCICRPEEA